MLTLPHCKSSTTFRSKILFYFQVPFVEALDLVRSRKVYLENVSNNKTWHVRVILHLDIAQFLQQCSLICYYDFFIFVLLQGCAYVPRDDLVSLVANEFRMQLSRALAVSLFLLLVILMIFFCSILLLITLAKCIMCLFPLDDCQGVTLPRGR